MDPIMSFDSFVRRHGRRLAAIAAAVAACLNAGVAAAAMPGSTWCSERCDELVLDWNATAHQVIAAADGYANPLAASRALAMMHLAMHDAVNAVIAAVRELRLGGTGARRRSRAGRGDRRA